MDIKILVATHKPYVFPNDNSIYTPIQLGCDEVTERFGILCDNTGENISYKRRFYSDLSAIYWGWKNLDCDYLGSCHYRRYFVSKKRNRGESEKIFRYILSRGELEEMLEECPVIVARPRRYFIQTIKQHYGYAHNPDDLDVARQVVSELHPDYLPEFDRVMNRTSAHIFNTFVMKKALFDAYAQWLFSILFEVERRVNLPDPSVDEYQARVLGYLAERLLDVWLCRNKIEYREVKLALLEPVNWVAKIAKFFVRKFLRKT